MKFAREEVVFKTSEESLENVETHSSFRTEMPNWTRLCSSFLQNSGFLLIRMVL